MRFLLKKWMRTGVFCTCVLASLYFGITAEAGDIENMENQSSELKDELSGVNKELLDIGNEIADVENKIEDTSGEIEKTREQLAIAKHSEEQQYEEMKMRIKYMYENDSVSMLEVLISAENMNDFLNKIDFIQNISEYDRNKLDELKALRTTIAEQEEHLVKEQSSQVKLQDQLDLRQAALQTKADEMSTDLASLKSQIQKLRDEEAKKAAEEARKKAEAEAQAKKEAEAAEAAAQANKEATDNKTASNSSSSGTKYDMPSGDGVLTKKKGVNYYKGHRETYYSQRVLPGHGLNIPGRHVASDGTIRDKDGYICVASSDYPKGTVVETSLGPGKVYDSGCAKGTIDLYTDW